MTSPLPLYTHRSPRSVIHVGIAGSDAHTRSFVKTALLEDVALVVDDAVAAGADSREEILILCLDQKILASRPPRRGDRRCLTTCGTVCVCQPAKQFDGAATAAEHTREQWRRALTRQIPVIALLCRGYSIADGCDWWPSFMEEFRTQLVRTRVFDARDVHADPRAMFLEESRDVCALYEAATRRGARSLYCESVHAQIIRKRFRSLNTALTDIRAAKKVAKELQGARRRLQKKAHVIRLSFNVETSALMAAVDSYSLAIPALVCEPEEEREGLQSDAAKDEELSSFESQQLREQQARHKRFAETVEAFRAAVEGVRSHDDEQLLLREEETWDELSARETEVQLRAKDILDRLIAEIFGDVSTVDKILGARCTTQVMVKLLHLKEQIPLSKILLDDVEAMVDFMYQEDQGAFERKAQHLQREWRSTVVPDLALHLETLIRERRDSSQKSN